MVTLDTYRQLLLAPALDKTLTELGWLRAASGPPPLFGCYYLVVGLCELTGEVVRGTGVYESDGRWITSDLDSGRPRAVVSSGWCFLDPQLGALVTDKEIHYYKPCPVALRSIMVYPWMNFAPVA